MDGASGGRVPCGGTRSVVVERRRREARVHISAVEVVRQSCGSGGGARVAEERRRSGGAEEERRRGGGGGVRR